MSIITGALALAVTPVALAQKGGDKDKIKDRDRSALAPTPAVAPAAPVVATAVACNAFTGKRKEFEVKGNVSAVSAAGLTVTITKANKRFINGAKASKSAGVYNAAPGTSNVAFVPFGTCTRVKAEGNRSRNEGRKDRSRRGGPVVSTSTSCVSFGGIYDRKARQICVGDRVQIQWRAPKGTNVATDLGAPRRIEARRGK